MLMALYGGFLIGIAAALLMVFNGRVLGISGIAGTFIHLLFNSTRRRSQKGEFEWRGYFLLGMLLGGGGLLLWTDTFSTVTMVSSHPVVYIVSGLLVGVGTRLGRGCTSGHGVCGISRFSGRSLLATLLFIFAGMVCVALVNAFLLLRIGGAE
jgi:uncharacterized membrane protein YedE/YeeE